MAPDRGSLSAKKDVSRSWESLTPSLSPWIVEAVASMNFTRMTPVQASTIPLFMTHKDVVVEAVTGSGKTLSFLIPAVERILRLEEPPKKHHVAVIVISPTRELASQIYNVLLSLLTFHGPSSASLKSVKQERKDGNEMVAEKGIEVFPSSAPKVVPQLLLGGSTTTAQDLSTFLKTSPNLLISTPGRLLELLSSPYVHCPQSSFEMLVVDEADRVLDLGFKDDVTKILSLLPKQRRTGLFSASVSEAVDQIIRVGLRNPVRIAVKVKGANGVQDKRTPASLKMTYVVTPASHKLPALNQILHNLSPTPLRTIVYLSTCAAVDYFQSLLPAILPAGMHLVPLHGKYPANVREKNFIRFIHSASPVVLLTTDVAARGLDIPEVDLVIQIDPPSDPKAFLHRCGRAGRAGRKGLSVVMLQPGREEDYVSFLEVRKTPIDKLEHPQIITTNDEADSVSSQLQQLVLSDRGLHDKAQKAFVSWLRSYSKHQASSIFRIADLDWADLAKGWALLKLPKMPELKGWDKSKFQGPEIDWEKYAYKDKQREKQRKQNLALPPPGSEAKPDKKRDTYAAWSDKVEHKANKAVKRSKKEAKKEFERKARLTSVEKEEEAETQKMIELVRKQQLQASAENATFEGFD